MSKHSIAEARNNLSKLVSRARNGEEVELTLRGEVVARISPTKPIGMKLDLEELKRHQTILENAADLDWAKVIREMRDEGY